MTTDERLTNLESEMAAIRRLLSGVTPNKPDAVQQWAAEYGIDLGEFVDVPLTPMGTITMSVQEAAKALGIGVEQTRRMLRDDRLIGVALGGRAGWRVARQSVAEELARRSAMAA